jgi:hypothetical protein
MRLRHYFLTAISTWFSFVGCSETPTNGSQSEKIGKPTITTIRQTSLSSINIAWKRASNDVGIDTVKIVDAFDFTNVKGRLAVSPQDTLNFEDLVDKGSYVVTVTSRDGLYDSHSITLSRDSLEFGKPKLIGFTQFGLEVTVRWIRDKSDFGTDTLHVIDKLTNGLINTYLIPYAGAQKTVLGLEIGKTYIFKVRSRDSDFDTAQYTVSGDSATIPPKDLEVNSLSSSQITATWTRDGSDATTDTLIATNAGGTIVASAIALSPSNKATLTGLSPGVLYKITVGSRGGRSSSVEWATATRSAKITLYETADPTSGHPSGLIFGDPSGVARAASVSGADSLLIDLVLATDNTSPYPYLSLQSANVVGSQIWNGRATVFGDTTYVITESGGNGLNAQYFSSGFNNEFNAGHNYFDKFDELNQTKGSSIVLFMKTGLIPPHYARVEIIPQANGLLWKNVGSYRAIDVVVSYQPMSDKAYAGRPGAIRGHDAPKVDGYYKIVQ